MNRHERLASREVRRRPTSCMVVVRIFQAMSARIAARHAAGGRAIRRRPSVFLSMAFVSAATLSPTTADTPALARKFVTEGRYGDAAMEFRRAAMDEPEALRRGGLYWAAAYSYWRAGEDSLTLRMLDRAEDQTTELATEAILLRAEAELTQARIDRARFYFENVANGKGEQGARSFANRRLAGIALLENDLQTAKDRIRLADPDASREVDAIERYAAGHDKSPALGGLLGIIPGLGYVYSGEYANAARCMILNGLFIYGLVNTADHEQWGAFSAIAFFELTWYTGSIYGGIDSAHRFNENRLSESIRAVQSGAELRPDVDRLPVVSLSFPLR